VRAARERRGHAFAIVPLRARREPEYLRQFLRDDRLAVAGDDHVDVLGARVEVVEETLGVKRAAGSCDGNNDFQSGKRIMAHYGRWNSPGKPGLPNPCEPNRRSNRRTERDCAWKASRSR